VVAEGGEVEAERIEHGDHLTALESFAVYTCRAQCGRTERIAGQNGKRVAIRIAQLTQQRGDARESARRSITGWRDFVDVVDLEECKTNGLGRGLGLDRSGCGWERRAARIQKCG
jgi:hypothetical protein